MEETINCSRATSSECFFWSTHSEAELDLFIIKGGKRLGFEFKYSDNPKISKSMRTALADLTLDHLYIIVPLNGYYLLDEKISVCGLDNVVGIFEKL